MAFGLVPIVSNYGFNKTVVDCDELVVEEFISDKYADIAINIIDKGLWEKYSHEMMRRVRENFSEEVVKEKYIEVLKRVLNSSKKGDMK